MFVDEFINISQSICKSASTHPLRFPTLAIHVRFFTDVILQAKEFIAKRIIELTTSAQ